jgi:hypothetical protein
MKPIVYVRLEYEEYKALEKQLAHYQDCEATSKVYGPEGFYHKAFRFDLGGMMIEIHGPIVRSAYEDKPDAG